MCVCVCVFNLIPDTDAIKVAKCNLFLFENRTKEGKRSERKINEPLKEVKKKLSGKQNN